MSKTERDVLIKLEQIIPNLVQKAMTKIADHDNPDEIKKLVLNMIMQGNLMQKLSDKVGASWKEFSMGFKSEIINLVKNEFAKHEEQEEFTSEQERHDIALACSYCLGESFIDTDGDLDDIYYAVLKVFDSTHDAPSDSNNEDEVHQWCKKHYKQIESMIN